MSGYSDLIYFSYGLLFVQLAIIAVFVAHYRRAVHWRWLAVSGVAIAFHQWIRVIYGLEIQAAWALWAQLALLSVAHGAMLEFARGGLQRAGIRLPRTLAALALLPLALLAPGLAPGLGRGPAGAVSLHSLAMAPIAWGLAAVFFFRIPSAPPERRRFLLAGAMATLVSLLQVTVFGFEVRLFGEVTPALAASLAVWLLCYALAMVAEGDERRARRVFLRFSGVLALVLLVGWLATQEAARLGARFQRAEHLRSMELVEGSLIAEVSQHERETAHLALLPRVSRSLLGPRPPEPYADIELVRHALLRPTLRLAVLDRSGRLVAHSGGPSEVPAGGNVADREYFQIAMKGMQATSFGYSRTLQRPVLYSAVPVRDDRGLIAGVLLSAQDLESLALFNLVPGEAYLVDPDGIVLLSNRPELQYRPFWPVAGEELERLRALRSIPIREREPIQARLPGDGDRLRRQGKWHTVLAERTIDDWQLIFVLPAPLEGAFRLTALGITLLFAIIVLGSLFGYQRDARAREELQASERRYRSIFEDNAVAMVLVDAETIRIVACNRAAETFYGVPAARLVGMKAAELADLPEEIMRQRVQTVLREKQFRIESRHRVWPEGIRDVEIFAAPMPYLGRESVCYLIHDISDKKRMATDRAAMLEQLVQSAKLASVGTLAAGVAHEINNPLTILKGFMSILRELIPDGTARAEILATIDKQEQAADRIAVIVDGLRSYTRAGTDLVTTVDLHRVIEETVTLTGQLLKRAQIDLKVELGSSQRFVRGNAGKIQQVLMNLLTNARDAMAGRDGARVISIATADEGGRVLLRVEDTGHGMEPAVRARIFDPFFTTKPPGRGTGLGLSITRTIVESFGATIRAESAPGLGSSFSISFVGTRAGTEEGEHGRGEAPAFRLKGNALVVDDEPEIRLMLRRQLESLGMSVVEAPDGAVALHRLSQGVFQLLLVDLEMPVVSGQELLWCLKQHGVPPETRIVVVTDGADVTMRPELLGLQRATLCKPFDRAALIRALREAVASGS